MNEKSWKLRWFPMLLLGFSFLQASTVALLPDEEATVITLYKLAQESEAEFRKLDKDKTEITQASVALETATNIYAELFLRFGHLPSLQRAIDLLRYTEPLKRYDITRKGFHPTEDIEISSTYMWNLKNPLFTQKYHLYLFDIRNTTNHTITVKETIVEIRDVNGEVYTNLDLRSDPALWEAVKNSPQYYSIQTILPGLDKSLKAVFMPIKAPIAHIRVNLEKDGWVVIPYLENLFSDVK